MVLNLTVSLSSYCDRNVIIQAMNEKNNISERESEEKKETLCMLGSKHLDSSALQGWVKK